MHPPHPPREKRGRKFASGKTVGSVRSSEQSGEIAKNQVKKMNDCYFGAGLLRPGRFLKISQACVQSPYH